MQNFTRPGFGPRPARYSEPEPVFPLSRRRPSRRSAFSARSTYASRDSFASRASAPSARLTSVRPTPLPQIPSARPTPLPETWPFNTEFESGVDEIDDDFADDAELPRPVTARQVAVRIFGFLMICAVVCGCAASLANPQATREALNWVTLGHADQVLQAAHLGGPAAQGAGETR
jgi:hypothetical protein